MKQWHHPLTDTVDYSSMVSQLKTVYLFRRSLWFEFWLSEKQKHYDKLHNNNFKSKNKRAPAVLICKTNMA